MKAPTIIMICCILSGCSEIPLPTVHEQLRQHILEAELGSAISISFAKKPVIPLPAKQDEVSLVNQLKAYDKETRWAAAEKLSYSANKNVETNKRKWAAYRLGEQRDANSVYLLISSLQDDDIEVVGRAAAALVRTKQHSLNPVRNSLETIDQQHSDNLRQYLYAVLGHISNKVDIEQLEISQRADAAPIAVISKSLNLIKRDADSSNKAN